jgi:rubrerythrin
MNVPEFIDLAEAIELRVSSLYELAAANTSDPPIANQLKRLSREELNHANILRTGRTYYESMPDLFSGLMMDETEAQEALKKAEEYLVQFRKEKLPILSQLKVMLDYEKRFEKIHMGASVKIKDEKLKELFNGLKEGDQFHIVVLGTLIDMLRDKV